MFIHEIDVHRGESIRSSEVQYEDIRIAKGKISDIQGIVYMMDIGTCNDDDWLVNPI